MRHDELSGSFLMAFRITVFAGVADGVVINLGTPTAAQVESMRLAAAAAQREDSPSDEEEAQGEGGAAGSLPLTPLEERLLRDEYKSRIDALRADGVP